jgi:hypothetical protein
MQSYDVVTSNDKSNFYWSDEFGQSHLMNSNPTRLSLEALGMRGLTDKRLICTPISDSGKPLVEAQPDGNPADVTQSAEVTEPTPDFVGIAQLNPSGEPLPTVSVLDESVKPQSNRGNRGKNRR